MTSSAFDTENKSAENTAGLALCACGAAVTCLQSPSGHPWKWVATCQRRHRTMVSNEDVSRIIDGFEAFAAYATTTPPDKSDGSDIAEES